MGKIKCSNCNKKIPESSTICPKCFYPRKNLLSKKAKDVEKRKVDNQLKDKFDSIDLEMLTKKLKGFEVRATVSSGPIIKVDVPKYDPTPILAEEIDGDYMNAEILITQGNFASSIKEFEKVLGSNPDPPIKLLAYFRIGLCYGQIGQHQDAIQNFDKSLIIMQKSHPYNRDGVMHDLKHIYFVGTDNLNEYVSRYSI